jgi:hypothetical protein
VFFKVGHDVDVRNFFAYPIKLELLYYGGFEFRYRYLQCFCQPPLKAKSGHTYGYSVIIIYIRQAFALAFALPYG